MQLKNDIFPLLAVLATNNTLISLDITGHLMGNKGATALGKTLQTNVSLTKLKWDDNGTTFPGFSYFKIGMKANQQIVNMPMPYNDILNCMKSNNWEGGNDKLVQVIKDIEGYLHRNLSAGNPPARPTKLSLARSSTMAAGNSGTATYKDLEQWMLHGGTEEDVADTTGEGEQQDGSL